MNTKDLGSASLRSTTPPASTITFPGAQTEGRRVFIGFDDLPTNAAATRAVLSGMTLWPLRGR